jgi:glycosyltransferase involved in cell wall biosynthesis
VSGSEDLIQPGVNGLLVEVEDYQGMAQALLTLLRNTSQAQQYGMEARTLIEQNYTLNEVMNKYIAIYKHLLNYDTTASNAMTTQVKNSSLAR